MRAVERKTSEDASLILDVALTADSDDLQRPLELNFTPEKLTNKNRYECDACKTLCDATQSVSVTHASCWPSKGSLQGMSVGDLRALMTQQGVPVDGCLEKSDMVDRIISSMAPDVLDRVIESAAHGAADVAPFFATPCCDSVRGEPQRGGKGPRSPNHAPGSRTLFSA